MQSNRRAFSCLTLAVCSALLVAQAIYPVTSFAGDGNQCLDRSNSARQTDMTAPATKMPGSDMPRNIAWLLLEANREEKTAFTLRKKADKCIEFMNDGLMSYEQQKRLKVQARQALRLADESEERSQVLRRQVEIAESGKNSVQIEGMCY